MNISAQADALPDEDAETQDKRICGACVREAYLNGVIAKQGEEFVCHYCRQSGTTIAIGTLAEIVEAAFQKHYTRTATGPDSFQYAMMNDREGTYTWEREGTPVADAISWAAKISEEAASDIQFILDDTHGSYDFDDIHGDETEFHSDSHYEFKSVGSGNWLAEWRTFERMLQGESRFFNPAATKYLQSLFSGIDRLSKPDGSPVVVNAGPGMAISRLYRARVFQAEEKLVDALGDIDRELASPPMISALAGRMNARGISVFYGATQALVARAEIRPPVGGYVLTAKFDIVQPIWLLDVTSLADIAVSGSVFDPTYAAELEKAVFLETFSELITRAVMPDDEALDYVATQVIADYLATQTDHPLDGLIYRSAQAPKQGANVVLFHKACRVARFDRPEGTEVDPSGGSADEDGWHTEYRVIDWLPDPKPAPPPISKLAQLFVPTSHPAGDARKIALEIDLQAVTVDVITGVIFESDSHKVSFSRYPKRNPF